MQQFVTVRCTAGRAARHISTTIFNLLRIMLNFTVPASSSSNSNNQAAVARAKITIPQLNKSNPTPPINPNHNQPNITHFSSLAKYYKQRHSTPHLNNEFPFTPAVVLELRYYYTSAAKLKLNEIFDNSIAPRIFEFDCSSPDQLFLQKVMSKTMAVHDHNNKKKVKKARANEKNQDKDKNQAQVNEWQLILASRLNIIHQFISKSLEHQRFNPYKAISLPRITNLPLYSSNDPHSKSLEIDLCECSLYPRRYSTNIIQFLDYNPYNSNLIFLAEILLNQHTKLIPSTLLQRSAGDKNNTVSWLNHSRYHNFVACIAVEHGLLQFVLPPLFSSNSPHQQQFLHILHAYHTDTLTLFYSYNDLNASIYITEQLKLCALFNRITSIIIFIDNLYTKDLNSGQFVYSKAKYDAACSLIIATIFKPLALINKRISIHYIPFNNNNAEHLLQSSENSSFKALFGGPSVLQLYQSIHANSNSKLPTIARIIQVAHNEVTVAVEAGILLAQELIQLYSQHTLQQTDFNVAISQHKLSPQLCWPHSISQPLYCSSKDPVTQLEEKFPDCFSAKQHNYLMQQAIDQDFVEQKQEEIAVNAVLAGDICRLQLSQYLSPKFIAPITLGEKYNNNKQASGAAATHAKLLEPVKDLQVGDIITQIPSCSSPTALQLASQLRVRVYVLHSSSVEEIWKNLAESAAVQISIIPQLMNKQTPAAVHTALQWWNVNLARIINVHTASQSVKMKNPSSQHIQPGDYLLCSLRSHHPLVISPQTPLLIRSSNSKDAVLGAGVVVSLHD
jgi:hypothetical protein